MWIAEEDIDRRQREAPRDREIALYGSEVWSFGWNEGFRPRS